LNHVKDFWFALVNDRPASVAKIDQHTVEELELMAPRVEAKAVHGLVISGQVFADFDENERVAIWEKLRLFNGLVPSLHSFFEDFKCFESWAHCLTRLFTLGKSTVRDTMNGLRIHSDDSVETCSVKTSESTFSSQAEPVSKHFDLTYRQMWLYAMRHYPEMPRDPKRQNRLAKAQNATADERIVSDMACLARRLGFKSTEITDLIDQSPDRLIARHALLRARKPDHFAYDDSVFNSSIDRIVDCFATATPKDIATPPPVLVSPSVKRKARCGHPRVRDLLQDRPLLFLDHMHAADIPAKVTTFFVRRCVYLAFLGPRPTVRGEVQRSPPPSVPMSPIFVSENSSMDGLELDLPNGGHVLSEDRPQGAVISSANPDDREVLRGNIVTGSTAELRTVAQLAAEQERIHSEAEQRIAEAQAAENARLQKIAEDITRRAQEAEERAAFHAAELARVRQEADERAHRTEQVGTERETDEDVAMALADLRNETAEGRAEPAPENIPLPPDADAPFPEPSRPVTQYDVASLIARWREHGSQLEGDNAQLARDTGKRMAREPRRLKPGGIRKSWLERRSMWQADNRATNRVAAISDQLGWTEHDSPPGLQVPESPGADMPATSAGDQADNDAEGRAVEMSAPKEAEQRPVAKPVALAQPPRDHTNSTTVENLTTEPFNHPQDIQPQPVESQSEEVPVSHILPSTVREEALVTEEDINELVDEILQNDAEQRALGEHDIQERALWEARQSAAVGNVQPEEEQVTQERTRTLAPLQTEVDNVPLLRETETRLPESSRPVTQYDVASLLAKWRDRGSQMESDDAQLPHDTRGRTAREKRRLKPGGIRKSWIGKRSTRQATNQEGGRVAAIHDQLGWDLGDPEGTVEETSVAEPIAPVQPPQRYMDCASADTNPAAMPLTHPDTVSGPPEPVAVADVFPSASGDGNGRGFGGGVPQAASPPLPSAIVPAERMRQQKARRDRIQKPPKAKARPRDAMRAADRLAAIDDELENESNVTRSAEPSAVEPGAAAPETEPTQSQSEMIAGTTQVRFDDSTENDELERDPAGSAPGRQGSGNVATRELRARPVTHYDFKALAGSKSRPSAISPRSGGMEGEQGPSGDRISITFYIYERD
jgi:hypothetical protein